MVKRAFSDHAQFSTTLSLRERQQAAIADLEVIAARTSDLGELMDLSSTILADALRVDVSHILRLRADGATLILQSAAGWAGEKIGQIVRLSPDDAPFSEALESHTPVVADLA